MHLFVILCILVNPSSVLLICAQDEHYPVDWSKAVTTKPKEVSPLELGKCICDMTWVSCDPNCCCDPDCSQAEVSTFSGCDPEGPPKDTLLCIDSNSVTLVNRITATITDDQLCIITANSPSLGFYFSEPADVSQATFNDAGVTSAYTFSSVAATVGTHTARGSIYKVGDQIMKINADDSRVFLPLPAPDFVGQCSDMNSALFLGKEQAYTCDVYTNNLAADCSTLYSPAKYVQNLVVASTPSGNGTTAIVNSTPTPSYSGGVCSNALSKLVYVITHNGAGEIVGVSVDVQVTSLSVWGTGNLFASLTQSFEVIFNKSDSQDSILRPKSGNPGYLYGLPVLLGVVESNPDNARTQAVQLPISAYRLPGSSSTTSMCEINAGPVIKYNNDIILSCKTALPTSVDSCADFSTSVLQVLRGNLSTHVGMYGDADYMNIYDWTTVYEDTPPTAAPDSTSSFCTQVPNSIRYQFLTTPTGSIENPQYKILSALVSYSYRDVKLYTTAVPTMEIYAYVSFVNIASSGTLEDLLPSPPLLPSFPDDILYPFQLQRNSARAPINGSKSHTLLFLALYIIICMRSYL